MEIISGIYKITNLVNNKFYIGSSKNIYRRWKDHRKITTRKKYKNYPLYSDMIIYGLKNFKFEIIEKCDNISKLKELEYNYIISLKPQYNRGIPWSKNNNSNNSNNNKNKICGIYKITNNITGDFYIGSSKNIKGRWDTHRRSYNYKINPKTKLYIAFHDYTLKNFKFEILEQCKEEHLFSREQYYIDLLKPAYNTAVAKAHLSKLEYEREYSIKNKEKIKKYKEINKEYISNRNKNYFSRKCLYKGEILSLSKLSNRFYKLQIKNPVTEAKKYLI